MSTQAQEAVAAYDSEFKKYIDKEKSAVALIAAVGELMYGKSVELVLFRNHLVDQSISEVLKLHAYAREVVKKPIIVQDTAELASEILKIDIVPSKLDIGKLAAEWMEEGKNFASKSDFLKHKLQKFIGVSSNALVPRDVVLYGFGRIGRLCARELVKQAGKGQQLRLRAIVTRGGTDAEILKRVALLRLDSVHGPFAGTVDVDLEKKTLNINGQIVHLIDAPAPEEVDYEKYGISNALIIDNTGAFTNREALSRHMKAKGAGKVLLTAPGKEIPNVVYGVNHSDLDREGETIFSAASCTTNAIVPVLKVINDALGVERGHIETVHAYTNDQNLIDNMHKKSRRGRSAAINMVITETGAGKAVTKCIPELKDKLTANAVRVPVPNGSLAVLSLTLNKTTTLEDLNGLLRKASLEGELVNQIYFSYEPELVSSDIIGNTCCSVFDSNATIVGPDAKNVVLYVWYDNEYGYTKQVMRLAKYICKVNRLVYY
ncbi:MAG: glyceraldehyde-3-phosphate dehydrogenase [Flavobacteriales bacterium]|nr:glyceraldehyde-3-phosphate dehydrogenase [Flavobacteriales bacterium]